VRAKLPTATDHTRTGTFAVAQVAVDIVVVSTTALSIRMVSTVLYKKVNIIEDGTFAQNIYNFASTDFNASV